MILTFEKWHGCKNDFIVTWLSDIDGDMVLDSLKRLAPKLCDRTGAGIGADGILVLHTKKRGDLTPDRLSIINSDGSTAKNCGNGLRCAALSVLKLHREKGNPQELPEAVEFNVEGRSIVCSFMLGSAVTGNASGARWPFVSVAMGEPRVGSEVPWEAAATAAVKSAASSTGVRGDFGVCDIGNPHVVIFADQATRADLQKIGPVLQAHNGGDGINVHLVTNEAVEPKDQKAAKDSIGHTIAERFRAFVWERGAGETQACGTGACAIAACAFESGLTDRSEWVAVDMPGGRLYVSQPDDGGPVTLAGPAEFVFAGQVSI